MAATGNTYDFSTLTYRDLTGIWESMIAGSPTFLKLIRTGAPALATKHEWTEDLLTDSTYKLTTVANGDGTTFACADTTGLVPGMLVRFETSTGASKAGIASIASVTNGTTFVITRDYGGTTLATLALNDVMKVTSRPQLEGSGVDLSAAETGTPAFNYTEIFTEAVPLSGTAQAVATAGNFNDINVQVLKKIERINYRLAQAIIWGRGNAGSNTVARSMKGLDELMSGGITDVTGGALTATHINNVIEKIWAAGGGSNNMAILCAPNQGRKLSALNATANPLKTIPQGSTTAGGYVTTFISDLPINGGQGANVVIDPTFPKDQVWLVDLDSIEFSPLRALRDFDATIPGTDGIARRVLIETTLTAYNAKQRNGKILNLNV